MFSGRAPLFLNNSRSYSPREASPICVVWLSWLVLLQSCRMQKFIKEGFRFAGGPVHLSAKISGLLARLPERLVVHGQEFGELFEMYPAQAD